VRICVIGGSGFIGTRLVAKLIEAGHDVVIFDVAPSTAFPTRVLRGDVRDEAAVAQALSDCDCVIQLAAEHRDDVRPVTKYFDVNVGGAKNVVAAMQRQRVSRAIFMSSVAVYGLAQTCPSETSNIEPDSPYGESKAQAEAIFAGWCAASTLLPSLVVLRPVVVFGEGNRGNMFNLIDQIRRNRFLMVGHGNNRKSAAYIENLVDFTCLQLHANAGIHVFNYADKPDRSIREWVDSIDAALGRAKRSNFAVPVWMGKAAGYVFDAVAWCTRRRLAVSRDRVRKFCADTTVSTPALDGTGFRPKWDMDAGLKRMIAQLNAKK
jgi:GlcNAc-P-P-Und epimerase